MGPLSTTECTYLPTYLTPNPMRALQRVGTHHVPFLQHPEWPKKSLQKVTCAARQHKPDAPNRRMGKYVRRITCFGARTSGHCHWAHREGTRPTCGHRNKWSMYPVPRCQRTPPGTQRTQSHIATGQNTGQLVDAATTHGAPLLSTTTVARQPDGHPHYLLEMWTPSASHPVAPPPVTGALPPHANGPPYPGTTPVAKQAL